MEAVFLRERGNLFSSEPHQKAFYHPSKAINLSKNEKKTCMSPVRPRPPGDSQPKAPNMDLYWDLDAVPVKSSSCGSPQFNESWPSSSETGGQSPGGWRERGEVDGHGGTTADTPTLATYIRRFRHAPATQRSKREKPRETFWWKQTPTTQDHLTPPKQPQGHSTPTSNSRKSVSATPKVSSDGDKSLEERTEVLIDKSSSLLTTSSTTSSLPAQKYLNTLKQQPFPLDSKPESAMSQPPSLACPLRELPLCPEEDILYQWRLRRRLEEARREAAMVGERGRVFNLERNRGKREEACSPYVCPRSSIPAQSHGYRSSDELDAITHAQPVQQCCRPSQLPNTCGGPTSVHQTVPPASHHPHFYLSHMHSSHIPPHKHMVCDIVPCPCCGSVEEECHVERTTESRTPPRPELAQGDLCVDKTREPKGGRCGAEATAEGVPTETSAHELEEVRGRRGEGDTGVGAEVAHEYTAQQWREDLLLDEGGGSEQGGGGREGGGEREGRERGGRGEGGRLSMQHLTPCGAEVTLEYASGHTTQHKREVLPLNGGKGKRGREGGGGVGGKDGRGGGGGGAGGREGWGGGRGGAGRPPVKYPSPSVLVRSGTRETSCDSESSDEGSQLSLTFSSEVEHSLTPRPGTPYSQSELGRKKNAGLSRWKSMANDCGAPSIEPIVSQAVKDHLFSSLCSPPPPTAITPPPTTVTTHTSPLRGTATSKGSLAAGRDDIHTLEIPWDNDMGDELLRVLIDKARLYEAQLWEVDRLLSMMDKDY